MADKKLERDYATMSVSEIVECVIEDSKKQRTFTERQDGNNGKNIACMVRGALK